MGSTYSDYLPIGFMMRHSIEKRRISLYFGLDTGIYIKDGVRILGHVRRGGSYFLPYGCLKFNIMKRFNLGFWVYQRNVRINFSSPLNPNSKNEFWLDFGFNYLLCKGYKMETMVNDYYFEADVSVYDISYDLTLMILSKMEALNMGIGFRGIYSKLFLDIYQLVDVYRLYKLKTVDKIFFGPLLTFEWDIISFNSLLYFHRFKGNDKLFLALSLALKVF
jgi:hypothetical protein